jgi:hypothetical protein
MAEEHRGPQARVVVEVVVRLAKPKNASGSNRL